MATETLDLTGSCGFEAYTYEESGHPTDVWLNYTERSNAHWSQDSVTSVPLDREDAERIVAFLQQHFKLEK